MHLGSFTKKNSRSWLKGDPFGQHQHPENLFDLVKHMFCHFPLLVLKGNYHYWTFFSQGTGKHMEDLNFPEPQTKWLHSLSLSETYRATLDLNDWQNPFRITLKPCLKPFFVGLYRGIIILGFLRWCLRGSRPSTVAGNCPRCVLNLGILSGLNLGSCGFKGSASKLDSIRISRSMLVFFWGGVRCPFGSWSLFNQGLQGTLLLQRAFLAQLV